MYQLRQHGADAIQKIIREAYAFLNLGKLLFPFGGQKRGLQLLRQDGNQGVALSGGDKDGFLLFLHPFHKPCGYQLFQNSGTGGWGSQSLALGILRHILNPCPLHGGQQRVL